MARKTRLAVLELVGAPGIFTNDAAGARINPIFRLNVHHLDPTDGANLLCNRMLISANASDPIAVVLQGFGMATPDPSAERWQREGTTALFNCAADGVAKSSCAEWWVTCWFANGISQSGDWMRRFSERLIERRRLDSRIPLPTRYFFDCEGWSDVVRTPTGAVDAFVAMRNDPRWSQAEVEGFGAPLAQLYDKAGAPPVSKGVPWWHESQRTWSGWFQGVLYQSADAAMKKAAFDIVREFSPSAESCNYGSSTSFDGVAERWDRIDGHPWMVFRHRSLARLQNPVLYVPANLSPTVDPEELASKSLAKAEQQLRGISQSYGGTPGGQIVPWLQIPGDRAIEGKPLPRTTPQLLSDLLAKSTAYGVKEVILWGNDDAWTNENWLSIIQACRK